MSLVFKEKMFVFGGTNDKNEKSKNIYLYEPKTDQWTKLQTSLMFGIEAGSVCKSLSQNEFYIFGGLVENGQTEGIWSLYLDEKTKGNNKSEITCVFQQKGKMNEKKAQHKIYKPKNQQFYVIFGGDKDPLTFYTNKLQELRSDSLLNLK